MAAPTPVRTSPPAYEAARAAGLTLFDTAEGYGNGTSEWLLGHLIRDGGDRERAVVATKFSALPWRIGRRGPLLTALEASLRRLALPRVALYQIHWRLPMMPVRPWLLDLVQASAQGLVGAVGVSNYGPRALRAAHAILADHGVGLATNQVEYSLLTRKPERSGLVETCRELGVTIIAYSPLAQGLLTGKYTAANPPPGVRGLRYRHRLPAVAAVVALLAEIGTAQGGRTPAQVALNWLIGKDALPIPGAKNAAQAASNAGGTGWALTADEVAALDRATRRG